MSIDLHSAGVAPASIARSVCPDQWAQCLSAPADLSSASSGWSKAMLRHWTGTSPDMHQPPLDHHLVVQHLGGVKRVDRRGEGAPVSAIVDCGALSIVPAGNEFRWHTHGPIEFAHLYISPAALAGAAARFDRGNSFKLMDLVGVRAPLLEGLFSAMLTALRQAGAAPGLYLDCLLETFVLTLLREHCSVKLRAPQRSETLPAYRLKRVIEFVDAGLDGKLSLADLAEVAGSSVFHFSRAFKNSVGEPPYRYVLRQRIERAKVLLSTTVLPLEAVARSCGFQNLGRFSKAFSLFAGDSPGRYRRG